MSEDVNAASNLSDRHVRPVVAGDADGARSMPGQSAPGRSAPAHCGPAHDAPDLPVSVAATEALPSEEVWRLILSVARRTPSPHNVQPWRVRLVGPHEAELFIDGARTLPSEDHTGSFLLSAMGMFVEAVDLLAARHGLRLVLEDQADAQALAAIVSRPAGPGLIRFARMRLMPDAGRPVLCSDDLFLARSTSRLSLRPTPVPGEAVAALTALGAEWGHTYTHVAGPAAIEPMIARNIEAVFDDLNLPAYHDELAGWFRYTRRATERRNDGLDWRAMNLSRAEFWLSAKFPGLVRAGPLRALFRRRYRRQLGHVPAIGVLAGDFFNPAEAVRSGRFLLRFWLELARRDLYMHPYGNLVTNPAAAAWLQAQTGVSRAWLVFKLGYSDPPPPSRRRPLQDILVTGGDAA